ncbi:MAG: type II secretion system F family protein [Candidatus Omnitrophica bacterium]|nr:type II secretion system F family protein [Candidatus Omnitrophota bacterium]
MAEFSYKARKGLAQLSEGTIEAQDKDAALEKLIAQGLFPINITESSPSQARRGSKRQNKNKGRITSGVILSFTQQLATLTRARVDLLTSLRILAEQADNPRFKEVILGLYNTTKEGKSFSESLEKFPVYFPSLFISIIRTGEASGKLDLALEQINEFMVRQENLKNKVFVALAYPALLVLVGLASIFVLMNFVIPGLRPIFARLDKDLPLITKVILKASEMSNKSWWIFLLPSGVAAYYLFCYSKGRAALGRLIIYLKCNLPILKRLTKNQELANFSRALSMLLKGGVPALKSLNISIPSLSTPKLKAELTRACQEIAQGQGFSKSMDNHTSLPKFFVKMVAVGEESGRLSEVLEEISHSYTQSLEKDIAIITSLIEPVLILIMGLILGTIVLSILLPTFQITQMVH